MAAFFILNKNNLTNKAFLFKKRKILYIYIKGLNIISVNRNLKTWRNKQWQIE